MIISTWDDVEEDKNREKRKGRIVLENPSFNFIFPHAAVAKHLHLLMWSWACGCMHYAPCLLFRDSGIGKEKAYMEVVF